MAAGQTILAITDLPFSYSFVNILFISILGKPTLETLPIVGMIAGLAGTFLLILHPIQKGFDKSYRERLNDFINYKFKGQSGNTIVDTGVSIDKELLLLSLNTSAMKYEKDKLAGNAYFILLLLEIAFSLAYPPFVEALNLQWYHIILLLAAIIGMIGGIVYTHRGDLKDFSRHMQLNALFFQLQSQASSNQISNWLDLAGRSIDLNDWTTAKEIIERILKSQRGMI
jgi:hypothetical protein